MCPQDTKVIDLQYDVVSQKDKFPMHTFIKNCLALFSPAGLLMGFVLSLSSLAFATPINGFVKLENGIRYLQVADGDTRFELKSATEAVSRNIERLNENDYLQGQGDISDQTLTLNSLDFIGLAHLLGAWHSKQDRALVTFEDFTTVSIFNSRTLGFDRVSVLAYSIAPDLGNDWKFFISGNKSVSIASMRLQGDSLVLQFINLETGNFEKPLELVRTHP